MAIEIESLSNDIPEPQKIDTGLDDILAGYTEAKTEEVEEVKQPEPIISNLSNDIPSPDSWVGNPAYYQTGKKAGQLRPKPKVTAKYIPGSSTIQATTIINGALFLTIIDIIIPLLIVTLNNWVSPKEKMNVKDLKLSNDEKKEITPLMDATLKQLNIIGNPFILLSITLLGSYGMKFMNKKLDISFPENEP